MNNPNTLSEIIRQESTYKPSKETVEKIGSICLVAVLAPFATGKSTITNTVCELDQDFSRVRSFTTRSIRPSENDRSYDFVGNSTTTHEGLLNKINKGELVQYTVHPTTRDVYGSRSDQYSSRYCLLEALPLSIPPLEKLGFNSVVKVCLTVEPEVWQKRVQERLVVGHDESNIKKRLQEGIDNINWALDQDDITIIDNSKSKPEISARSLIQSVKYNILDNDQQEARETAIRLLGHFKRLI